MTRQQLIIDAVVDLAALGCITALIMTDHVSAEAGLPVMVALIGVKTGTAIRGGAAPKGGPGGGVTSILALLFAASTATAADAPAGGLDVDTSGEHRAVAE